MSNVVTFLSSASNTGTTSTTLSVGYALAQHSNAKVGVLLLNAWDDGTDFYSDPPAYLNEIKSRLAGRSFTDDEDFFSKFKRIGNDENLYILAGNQDRLMERLFNPNEVNYLIERSKNVFDVVLIDAGCHFDNALSAQSLLHADHRYLILTQQPKAVKRFVQLYENIFQGLDVEKKDLTLIVNRYQSKSYMQTKKELAKFLEMPLITAIEDVPDGWLCELENKILYSYDNPSYQKSIMTVVEELAKHADIQLLNENNRKRRGLARMFA